jgi:hypothetical protein
MLSLSLSHFLNERGCCRTLTPVRQAVPISTKTYKKQPYRQVACPIWSLVASYEVLGGVLQQPLRLSDASVQCEYNPVSSSLSYSVPTF